MKSEMKSELNQINCVQRGYEDRILKSVYRAKKKNDLETILHIVARLNGQ